jgi:hypothetical protein
VRKLVKDMWMDYWTYSCDKCQKEIKPDDPLQPTVSLEAMLKTGRFYIRKSSKGNILHYCSEYCLNAHFRPGKGTPVYKIIRPSS